MKAPEAAPTVQSTLGVDTRVGRRTWCGVALFLTIFFLAIAWSTSTPLWASPDEDSQVLKAWSVVHGQFLVPADPRGGAVLNVPRGLVQSAASIKCLKFHASQNGTCIVPVFSDSEPVSVLNPAGRYNPMYYLLVGWPTLFLPMTWAPLTMRVASAALTALFLTSAVAALTQRGLPRSTVAVGVLAFTPMTVFLGSVVNPNGLEIMAGAALWANGLVLCTAAHRIGEASARRLTRRAGLAATAMVLTRGLSPLWLVAIVIVCLTASTSESRKAIPRRPLLAWGAIATFALVAAVIWVFVSAEFALGTASRGVGGSLAHRFSTVLSSQRGKWPQLVGNFGWLDTPLPSFVCALWFGALACVVLVAVVVGRAWQRIAMLLAVLAAFVMPVLIETRTVNVTGLIWQGRYSLPLVVGLPMLAAVVMADRDVTKMAERIWRSLGVGSVLVTLGVGLAGFVWALHRYVDGLAYKGGLRSLKLDGPWQPPLGARLTAALIATLFIGGALISSVYVTRQTSDQPPAG